MSSKPGGNIWTETGIVHFSKGTNSKIKTIFEKYEVVKAREVLSNGRKSYVIYIPIPKLQEFRQKQVNILRECEKLFDGQRVVFIGDRRILRRQTRNSHIKKICKQKRPQSRTLTAVHDAILEDIVFPAEIVGKRIRVRLDGSRIIKIHLDQAAKFFVEPKVDTFAAIYKNLVGKQVVFEFPETMF